MNIARRSRTPLRVSAFVLAAAMLAGGAWHFSSVAQDRADGARPQDQSQAQSLSRAFRDTAHAAIPTVVTIRVQTKPRQLTRGEIGENPFKGTPFEDFFGQEFGRQLPRFLPKRSGVGSGVIIDKSGLVLTNNHVVENADEVIVELNDGREFKAQDVKTDPATDLAVLRISGAGDLPAARLGDSDKLQIGDWVIAVGSPFELQTTVSAGIISGTGRELSSVPRAKFLQTDAAINPGNSGGPLLNLDGEVVGINTAIASSSGGYQGIGFAIPINTAKWITRQLIEKGSVDRAYLGVKIGEVNKELAEQFGVSRGEGVLVAEVMPHTPAADAGFKEGDIITSFAGKKIHDPRELQELVERSPFDSKQEVIVLRDGKPTSLTVVVKPMPKELASAENGEAESGDKSYSSSKLGIGVSDLGAEEAKQLGYRDVEGALVTSVEPGSIAAEKGIREGMLIRRVGKTPIKNRRDFEAAVEHASLDEGVLLLVRTPQGNQFFVVLKAEPAANR
jgi:serine protease Do